MKNRDVIRKRLNAKDELLKLRSSKKKRLSVKDKHLNSRE